MRDLDDLIGAARAVARTACAEPAAWGLVRLAGGLTHDVFATESDPRLVVKVYRSRAGDEPDLEWDALTALDGLRIAPPPVHFDRGDPPAVVMGHLPGMPLTAEALDKLHAGAIGAAHRLVHGLIPPRRAAPLNRGLRAARQSLLEREVPAASDLGHAADLVAQAWRASRTWFADVEIEQLTRPDRLRFTRGDPNLTNYLWSGEGLTLIDWENSGYNDPALELADMAEHASTRPLSESFWAALADATDLNAADRAHVPVGRRAIACFWLVIIESRHRKGLPTTVTLEAQARRTLATLGV